MWSQGPARKACHSSSQLRMNIHASGGRLCAKYLRVCLFWRDKAGGKKKKEKIRSMCVRGCCKFFFFFFFAGSSKSDSPDGPPLATWPPLVTRRPNTARARVSVGWNAKVSHSLDAHTSEMCTHVHTHTHTHGAPGQNSTDVLAVAACESARAGVFDGDGDGEGLVRGSGGGWVWGARREAGALSRRASSEILMPRSASDLPSDSRSDMSTQIRRRLGEKKTSKATKTRSQNLFSDKLSGSFLTRIVPKLWHRSTTPMPPDSLFPQWLD